MGIAHHSMSVYERVKKIIVEYLRVNDEEVEPDMHVVNDLGADSLALVELGFRFSEAFSIPVIEANEKLLLVEDLVLFIQEQMSKNTTDFPVILCLNIFHS